MPRPLSLRHFKVQTLRFPALRRPASNRAYSRNCQTSTASPAKPGELPVGLVHGQGDRPCLDGENVGTDGQKRWTAMFWYSPAQVAGGVLVDAANSAGLWVLGSASPNRCLSTRPESNYVSGAKKGVSGLDQSNCPLRKIG